MTNGGSDELVFTVSGSIATPVARIDLADAGFTERQHLQEWVIGHPETLGPDVLIVTFEFDRWSSASGPQRDRLDVLGLGRDGRLVVAELKRGRAPDTVELQAIKYAAMASRFTEDLLAELHAAYSTARGEVLTDAAALDRLRTHSDVGIQPELLLQPRIVLLAESYPPAVTSTAVWLNEMGLDVTLLQYQAYRTGQEETLLTLSQLYPVREVKAFEVAPHSRAARIQEDAGPPVPWTRADLAELATVANPTTLAILDLCSDAPGTWVVSNAVWDHAGVTSASGIGQLGGFGLTVRSRFGRTNTPFQRRWGHDGAEYLVPVDLAATWIELREASEASDPPAPRDGLQPPIGNDPELIGGDVAGSH